MARINIEDSLFKDARFINLCIFYGSRTSALGSICWAFIVAQKFYLNTETERLIPLSEWKRQECDDKLIDFGLAEVRPNGIYVSGSEAQFAWLIQKQEAGKKGGRPKSNITPIQKAGGYRAKAGQSGPNPPTLTPTQKKNINTLSSPDGADDTSQQYDLEKIYQEYPKRSGGQNKKAGLVRLKGIIKTKADYELALLAVKNYSLHLTATNRIGTEFVKMFSSFWDRQGDWKEWAVKQNHQSDPLVVKKVVIDLS